MKRDRKLRVENIQQHFVDREIYQQSLEATTINRSKKILWHHSNEEILLTVAELKPTTQGIAEQPIKSFIKIEKDKITIQAPRVEINPGIQAPPLPPKPDPLSPAEQRYTYFFGAP